MAGHLSQFLPPPEAVKILTVLLLSFLIGLERKEHKANGDYSFGGVRTFPLIGLMGSAVALLSKDQLLPLALGFAVVGAFLLMSYRHKLSAAQVLAESPGAPQKSGPDRRARSLDIQQLLLDRRNDYRRQPIAT